ncbi:hypothetical protein DIS24_g282 [Lasiodiplodia hormozganensis]|uniref:F-box domain-containing protein n=1 Tax=Lasiodiplodia hormozganensis TaxID=869390 RepID=A0AA40D902_9PEZI|nr:hypothetical protein DIS24_g282 [Lasiodiplodia hormozganensis]
MTKMDEVLETPELLEHILAQLPMRDLLLAQQVCRRFNSIIASSPTLQQALFFRPRPATATPKPSSIKLLHYPGDEPVAETWERNPLLASAFWPWFDRSTPKSRFSAPFWDPDIFSTLPLADEQTRFAFLRPEASWRRMLLTQPAVAALDIMLVSHSALRGTIDDASLCLGSGLRMGVLYDVTCQEILGSRYRAKRRFRVQWHGADRRIVLNIASTAQCKKRDNNDAVWKSYFSGACQGKGLEWRKRDTDWRIVPDEVLLAGDYEVEE